MYIAGSFTEPPWEPIAMDYLEHKSNQSAAMEAVDWLQSSYEFYKNFNLPTGEYQYKFRLGDNDSWVLDQNSEIGWSLTQSSIC